MSSGGGMSPTGQMRISIPPPRLATIAETANAPGTPPTPPIPRRSSRRRSVVESASSGAASSTRRWSGSQDTMKTGPPPYDWVPSPLDTPTDEKDVAQESQKEVEGGGDESAKRTWLRSRAARLALAAGAVLLLLLALAVGLGVGLSRRNDSGSKSASQPPTSPDTGTPPQQFPLGRYSFVTALMTTQTSCTSNPATWRCNPLNTSSPSSSGSDLVTFNWMISSTSNTYAFHNSPGSTPASGVSSNLTISSISDTFGISFNNKSLTYFESPSNTSSPRYTFTFTLPKVVTPYPYITSNGATAKCFFNETVITGSIYLSAVRNDLARHVNDSKGGHAFQEWPHAIEITQVAHGGTNVPNCYEVVNGAVGDPITPAFIPQAQDSDCLCGYRNY